MGIMVISVLVHNSKHQKGRWERNHHSLRDSYVADIAKVRHCIQSLKYMITKLAQIPWQSAGRPLLVLSFGACKRWFFHQKRRHTNLWLWGTTNQGNLKFATAFKQKKQSDESNLPRIGPRNS
jgi:hypothetical protein